MLQSMVCCAALSGEKQPDKVSQHPTQPRWREELRVLCLEANQRTLVWGWLWSSDVTTLLSVEIVVYLITLPTKYHISIHFRTRSQTPKHYHKAHMTSQSSRRTQPFVNLITHRQFHQKLYSQQLWLAESLTYCWSLKQPAVVWVSTVLD